MATIILQSVGSAIGGPLGGMFGAALGGIGDMMLGSMLSRQKSPMQYGPRLTDVKIQNSTEGAPILKSFGRNRIAGTLIWATRYKEVVTVTTTKSKGGGGKSTAAPPAQKTTNYLYYCSFAVALCEGPIINIGRIWVDNKILDLNGKTYRVYKGDESQTPDSKITAVEGAANTPAFKGLAYIVFEDFPLADYGNRIPQMNIEVLSTTNTATVEIEDKIKAITIIPATGEFVYATDTISKTYGGVSSWSVGTTGYENKHTNVDKVDFISSLDTLQDTVPNLDIASLVVGWHGTDLRCGNCSIVPKVEIPNKATSPWSWSVSGLTRDTAQVVSSDADGPLLGGAPDDKSIFQAITEIKVRGKKVCFYPFILMDIPSTNSLPNPYSNNAATIGQSAFPWRGRITTSPAPGYTGNVDKNAATTTQVNAFLGTCIPSNFGAWNGYTIPYSGPSEWSYRRFILHYAKLCAAAGGVDAFIIGSELVQLTFARSAAGTYPFVTGLKTLAAEVKAILGAGCKVGYAANWDEYHSHRPADGSGDVYFHLDPLWSDSNIDFVGIDNYVPLSDWRDTPGHLDGTVYDSIYDLEYLKSNIEGGENYSWYYASAADRESQNRTSIADPTYSKPWVFRNKDFKNWWLNNHKNRPLGVESGSNTSWTAQSKPIWFTEFGCPAIDKGTNQPNVFVDPKSSESEKPYFSTGFRDNLIQRQYFDAMYLHYGSVTNNPVSAVYGTSMIPLTRMFAWTWDARPYPDFPQRTDIWRDYDNWQYGHWLSGRLGVVQLPQLVERLCDGLNVAVDTSKLSGVVYGYLIDSIMSPRSALEPLALAYQFDAFESEGVIKFVHRGGNPKIALSKDNLVASDSDSGDIFSLTRAQETELPVQVTLKYTDLDSDYAVGTSVARRLIGSSKAVSDNSLALVLERDYAQNVASILLMDAWAMRESVELTLPPSKLALDPSDVLTLTVNNRTFDFRLEEIGYEFKRPVKGVRTDRGIYYKTIGPQTNKKQGTVLTPGSSGIQLLDLPMLNENVNPYGMWAALYANPWVSYAIYRSPTNSDYTLDIIAPTRSSVGNILNIVNPGPEGRWDYSNKITVKMLTDDVLESRDELQVFDGKNVAAMKGNNGEWEVVQWKTATLVSLDTYELTGLLRAQLGTEKAMNSIIPADAPFVLLDSLNQSSVGLESFKAPLNWKYGPSARDIGDPTYVVVSNTNNCTGLRPYSPVDLRAIRVSSGDLTLSWKRRTRFKGDSWEGLEIPLNEDIERYQLDIWNSANTLVVRSVVVDDVQSYLYTAAQQTADHGAPITQVRITVYQVSVIYGNGPGRKELLTT